jgi:hypothetical protein
VEVKVVNLAGWGVRIAMFPVCNKATNVIIITTTCAEGTDQIPDPSTPLSAWYVVRLLWEAGFLRNSEEKPDLLIADGAFISVSLVAYLKARYNIDILGQSKSAVLGLSRRLRMNYSCLINKVWWRGRGSNRRSQTWLLRGESLVLTLLVLLAQNFRAAHVAALVPQWFLSHWG